MYGESLLWSGEGKRGGGGGARRREVGEDGGGGEGGGGRGVEDRNLCGRILRLDGRRLWVAMVFISWEQCMNRSD